MKLLEDVLKNMKGVGLLLLLLGVMSVAYAGDITSETITRWSDTADEVDILKTNTATKAQGITADAALPSSSTNDLAVVNLTITGGIDLGGFYITNAARVYLNTVDYIYTDGTNLLWSNN